MVQRSQQCKNHEFIENSFDIPKTHPPGYVPRLKKTYQDEFCKHCGLNRKPVLVNGEFSEWFYFNQVIPTDNRPYLGKGPIKIFG